MNKYTFCPRCKGELKKGDLGYLECSQDACKFIHYENPTPVVAAVVEYGQEHVVLAHNVLWPKGWFGLITGFLEKGEVPEETVLREVEEELGLKGSLVSFIGHYSFDRMNQLIIAFHVKADGQITLNEELDEYRVVPFGKARYWPSGTGYALRDLLVAKGYSPEMVSFTSS